MPLDHFGFLLIELGEFGACGVVDAQQFIEFGMQRQIIAAVGSLNEQRHQKYRQRCNRIPVEGGSIEYQPQHSVNDNDKEGGGMSRRLSDTCRPMPLGWRRHTCFFELRRLSSPPCD